MRSFGFIVEKLGIFHQPRVPDARVSRANPPDVRLLEEAMKTAFDLACLNGELDTAADLLAVVTKRHADRTKDDPDARRERGLLVSRMRGELDRRHIVRGTRPPDGLWRDLPGD